MSKTNGQVRSCFVVAVAVAFILASPHYAMAENPRVIDVVKNETPQSQINISARVTGAFAHDIVDTIKAGAPVTFTYFIRLERNRVFFWDKTEKEQVVKKMVKYDPLKKIYLVYEKRGPDEDEIDFEQEISLLEKRGNNQTEEDLADGEGNLHRDQKPKNENSPVAPQIIEKQSEMKEWMTRLKNIPINTTDLPEFGVYRASVRGEIKSIKLIPPFNYILFFLTLFDFETEWAYTTPFIFKNRQSKVKSITRHKSAPDLVPSEP